MKKTIILFLLVALIIVSCKPEPEAEQELIIQVTNLELDKTSAVIEAGSSITITATVFPDDASDKTITWTTSDEAIATVENGVVTGLKEGVAKITAISCGGGR